MNVLDLGCGTDKIEGAIGVDMVALPGVDVIANLSEYPYPFADNSFDVVYLNDVIEHLPNTIKTMEEIHRISRPNAKIFIRVVNWNSHFTAMDPTHVRAFTENSFDFFGKRGGRSYYTHARFDVVKVDHQYNAMASRFLISRNLMKFLSFYLCNILEGLNFELCALKESMPPISRSGDDDKDRFSLLRCPHCISLKHGNQDDPGRLKLFRGCWLVCQEAKCGRKYPLYNGPPVMLIRESDNWVDISTDDLPVNPGQSSASQ
jgi:SAM-dependent methyltransferase